MHIHYLQHEPFEDLAAIFSWTDKPGNKITCTKLYEEHLLPSLENIDLLIIMGGAMGVYEEDKYPWLEEEKQFIRKAIADGKKVVGICLGAQLIAAAMGSKVYKNKEKEIGWFEIELTSEARENKYFRTFPSSLTVFHWHGDTFDLPEGAVHIAKSKACRNQAFTFGENVVALQFHIEATEKSIKELAYNCREEMIDAPYVQKEEEVMKNVYRTEEMNQLMFGILDAMNA